MKRIVILLSAMAVTIILFAQNRPVPAKILNTQTVKQEMFSKPRTAPSIFNSIFDYEEELIGYSYWDLQTNNSCQNRIYVYNDGDIGTTWNLGLTPYYYSDRGTGYNYYNGESWLPFPTGRIESQRSGWPSYAPLGESGEIIVSHLAWPATDVGLFINKRVNRGTGLWNETLFHGPTGHETLLWPRMVTGGVNHDKIFLLALTEPVSHGGITYHGLDGALLYSLSNDGGETWEILNQILPGMDSTEYTGFVYDCYAIAEPKDNIVAFVVGSYAQDMFLMKSIDYGQTFEKTLIWDHPYDSITPVVAKDTFYCVDGSLAISLDQNGMAHTAFGIVRTYFDETQHSWRFNKNTDGVGYWNETMPAFSSDPNALNPYGDPQSELIPDYNLIGWAQDINGDGAITYLDDYFGYQHYGISSMVQLVIDDFNRIFLFFTSVTECYDNGIMNYRRLWSRSSTDGGFTWGPFYHFFVNDSSTIWNEFSFPDCAANSDDFLYLTVQVDMEPGIFNFPSENEEQNDLKFIKIPKDEIVGINQPKIKMLDFTVSQNFPNPLSETTTIKVNLQIPSEIQLTVKNMLGQEVYDSGLFQGKAGLNKLTITKNGLTSGAYFYTVKAGEKSITMKMIID